MKLLSIIIPTYNMEALLDQCLSSLILADAEKRSLLDVIVVIDGATDRSSEIAHGYEQRHPETFRVIDKANGNYGSCINAALPHVEGKYVRILDADDSYLTENLPAYLDVLDKQDVDLVLTPFDTVDAEGNVTSETTYPLTENKEVTFSELPHGMGLAMHAVAYRSNIFQRISYHQTEGVSYTDMEWIFHPMSEVHSVYYYNHPIYRYLMGREGQTVSNDVRLKRLGHVVKGLWTQLAVFETISPKNMAYAYMSRIVDNRIKTIYGLGLARTATINLEEFDLALRQKFPAAYKRAELYTIPVGIFGLEMHIVSMWRKVRSRKGMRRFPKYLLYLIVSKIFA